MSALSRRVQYDILHGVGHEQLHSSLAELRIETREPKLDALERLRYLILRESDPDEQQLRDAFSDIGNITGSDPALLREELARRLRARLKS